MKHRIAQLFDGGSIDRQHPRPAVLAVPLEIIERKDFVGLLATYVA